MANRVSASIEIGGSISSDQYLELADLIAAEHLSIEWDGPVFLPEHRTEGERLQVHAHEVSWGSFDDLEQWCIEHALPFARWCGGYEGEWTPERVVFTGSGTPETYTADHNDCILVDRGDVERLGSMEVLRAYFAAADFQVPVLFVVDTAPTV